MVTATARASPAADLRGQERRDARPIALLRHADYTILAERRPDDQEENHAFFDEDRREKRQRDPFAG